MKKNLTKVLARLAKDGDAETVAEFIGEMIGQNPGETSGEESLTVEVPENREVTIDSEALAGVTERLDQMIALLSALLAPAAPTAEDEGPEEEVAEIVEEVLEAAKEEKEEAPLPRFHLPIKQRGDGELADGQELRDVQHDGHDPGGRLRAGN